MKIQFNSSLTQYFVDFIKLRRIAGLDYSKQEAYLVTFDQFLLERDHEGGLSHVIIEGFMQTESMKMNYDKKTRFYQVIRHFYDYLSIFFSEQSRLPMGEYRRVANRPTPRIFTEDELARILIKAQMVSRHNHIRNKTLHAALAIAIGCGLRRSEITNLCRSDMDFENAVLHIRETKFDKSRIIPIGADLCEILKAYDEFRLREYPYVVVDNFFITMHKSGMSSSWFYQSFREILGKLEIAPQTGRGPHLHDLRHTFAVRCLTTWYKEGKDVQELLPALATYMGHTHYSDTAYYLSMTANILGFALDRFDSIWKNEVHHAEN